MVYSFIENHWGKMVVTLIIAIMAVTIFIQGNRIDKRDNTIVTLHAEAKLGELQQDALRKAIIDQSEAVEKQRIDAEKRAAKFDTESKRIWFDFEKMKEQVKDLVGDAECQAMREIIRGAVE